MLQPPRRRQQLTVALPSSFTRDIPHLREKTNRAGIVARALAIFRVDRVLIYDDTADSISKKEGHLFQKLLSYQETPQYLRRRLFAQDPDLQFVGILPPLRLPSHPDVQEPRPGLVRESVVVETEAESRVDAGFGTLVKVPTRLKRFDRVSVRLTRKEPQLEGEVVDPNRLPIYWGFRVTRTGSTLGKLIRGERSDLTISTSRKGRSIRDVQDALGLKWDTSGKTLVLFGSPDLGVPEILNREGLEVDRVTTFNLNMIPSQGVETVRTEEALIATLSQLNALGDE